MCGDLGRGCSGLGAPQGPVGQTEHAGPPSIGCPSPRLVLTGPPGPVHQARLARRLRRGGHGLAERGSGRGAPRGAHACGDGETGWSAKVGCCGVGVGSPLVSRSRWGAS